MKLNIHRILSMWSGFTVKAGSLLLFIFLLTSISADAQGRRIPSNSYNSTDTAPSAPLKITNVETEKVIAATKASRYNLAGTEEYWSDPRLWQPYKQWQLIEVEFQVFVIINRYKPEYALAVGDHPNGDVSFQKHEGNWGDSKFRWVFRRYGSGFYVGDWFVLLNKEWKLLTVDQETGRLSYYKAPWNLLIPGIMGTVGSNSRWKIEAIEGAEGKVPFFVR